jgi:phenylacetaldehyde dehydrogenase
MPHPGVSAAVRTFLSKPHPLFIGGEWIEPEKGGVFSTFDPATGAHLAEIGEAEAADVDRAVIAARAAFNGPWSRLTARARANLLFRLAELIALHQDTFEQLEVLDNGMLRFVARATVSSRPDLFRYYAGWPERIEGATIPNSGYRAPGDELFTYTLREPVGVAALIAPWNVPLAIACLKLAPALAAGCTVVLKPAELTPLSALLLGELIAEADFPPGVVNIVNGGWRRGGRGHRPASGHRQGLVHRLDRCGQEHRPGRRRQPEACVLGAWRQGARHYLRRRRSGDDLAGCRRRDLRPARAKLHGRHPHLR